MSELTQSERATIEDQYGDLEAHIISEVSRSEKKISNVFSGTYTPGLTDNQVIVYIDTVYDHDRVSIINAAMNHPHMNIQLSAISDFPVEEEDSSAFLIFETPGVDNE